MSDLQTTSLALLRAPETDEHGKARKVYMSAMVLPEHRAVLDAVAEKHDTTLAGALRLVVEAYARAELAKVIG